MALNYTSEVIIEKGIDEVIEKFQNRENDRHWMPGLIEQTTLEGTANEEGCLTKLVFDVDGQQFSMTERVVNKNLPENYTTYYDSPFAKNTVVSTFERLADNKTRYTTDNEFHFNDPSMESMAQENPQPFIDQSQVYLKSFKSFIEKE